MDSTVLGVTRPVKLGTVARGAASLREAVHASLRRDIILGTYPPGTLLTEKRLADTLEISKTPVREALAMLIQEGYVELKSRTGYLVRHFTVEEAENLFDLRVILEGASAELAARFITPQEIRTLRGYIVPISRRGQSEQDLEFEWLELNSEFHYQVARSSRNPPLAEAVRDVLQRLDRMMWLRVEYGITFTSEEQHLLNAHQKTVDALEARDADGARAVITTGIRESKEIVLGAVAVGRR